MYPSKTPVAYEYWLLIFYLTNNSKIMKINYFLKSLFALILMLSSFCTISQFAASDVEFWVGSGSNQAIFVIDFNDSTNNESYAWGFRFDGTSTGEEAINSIVSADNNLSANIVGGFINDLAYQSHSGFYENPNYWSTWSGTSSADWTMNMGMGSTINNNDWFGCSYTDFDPAIEPGEPIAAQSSTSISNVDFQNRIAYPNPCRSNFNISETIENFEKIEISNISGKIVKTFKTKTLDVSNLKNGVYFVKIISKNEVIVTKIIKK